MEGNCKYYNVSSDAKLIILDSGNLLLHHTLCDSIKHGSLIILYDNKVISYEELVEVFTCISVLYTYFGYLVLLNNGKIISILHSYHWHMYESEEVDDIYNMKDFMFSINSDYIEYVEGIHSTTLSNIDLDTCHPYAFNVVFFVSKTGTLSFIKQNVNSVPDYIFNVNSLYIFKCYIVIVSDTLQIYCTDMNKKINPSLNDWLGIDKEQIKSISCDSNGITIQLVNNKIFEICDDYINVNDIKKRLVCSYTVGFETYYFIDNELIKHSDFETVVEDIELGTKSVQISKLESLKVLDVLHCSLGLIVIESSGKLTYIGWIKKYSAYILPGLLGIIELTGGIIMCIYFNTFNIIWADGLFEIEAFYMVEDVHTINCLDAATFKLKQYGDGSYI